jgi:hypothetical protein
MALLIFEDPNIPKLTGEYLNFDFYMLDITFTSYQEDYQEQFIDKAKRELDLIKDKVTFLNLRCYRVVKKSFIDIFKNLTKLGLYNISFKAINSVLNTLKDNSINLKKLSIFLAFQEDKYPKRSDHKQKQVTKFSLPSLVSLSLGRFSSTTFMEVFDFSNIRTLKLKECFLYDLPISDTIEDLEITSCNKYTSSTLNKILMLKNLKSLKLKSCSLFFSEFLMVLYRIKSLRKISLSDYIDVDAFITCLLKDGIQEIDFSNSSLICDNDAKSIRAISCALCTTTAKKLHLNRCTLNSTMLNILRENSRWIEYISLREILAINSNAAKAFEDLIKHAEFRVCDLRFIDESYISSPITQSNIDNILIDYRCSMMQKFSKLIESGKAIPMKDVEVSLMQSFPTLESDKGIMLDPGILRGMQYHKYFPVYYIDSSDNMKANLREIVIAKDLRGNPILSGINSSGTDVKASFTTMNNTCIRIKLPPNRHINISPKPDYVTEIKSDYDFTIIIRIDNEGRTEETRIPCHKSILSSKSEMFRSMFSSQMKENMLNEMVTDNIYYKDFIQYLYTYRVNLNKENIIPLIELARMHFIKDLEYKILGYIHMHKEQMDIERCVLEKYDLLL